MLAKQRYNKIMELLDKDGIVHTAELVKLMGVSSETIRKDLEYPGQPGTPVQGTWRGRPLETGKTQRTFRGLHFPSDP